MPALTHFFIFIIIASIGGTAWANTYYKWTDENGTVHYSEQKPQDTDSQAVKTYGSKRATMPAPTATTDATDAAAQAENPQALSDGGLPIYEPAKIKKDPAICKQAKTNLQIMQTKPIIRQNNAVLTAAQKQKEIKKLQQAIKDYC